MKTYSQRKEEARQNAIETQYCNANATQYMSEVLEQCEKFTKLGKRYGLLNEFRENGII